MQLNIAYHTLSKEQLDLEVLCRMEEIIRSNLTNAEKLKILVVTCENYKILSELYERYPSVKREDSDSISADSAS
jgi:hypothetical protein